MHPDRKFHNYSGASKSGDRRYLPTILSNTLIMLSSTHMAEPAMMLLFNLSFVEESVNSNTTFFGTEYPNIFTVSTLSTIKIEVHRPILA